MSLNKRVFQFLRVAREDIFSPQLSKWEKANKIWDYFKRGNSEIRQFWGIWNFVLLIAIKLNIDLNWKMIAAWTVLFIPVSIGVGVFFTKKVNIMSNKTNPFTQDSIMSSIWSQRSLLHLFEYNKTGDKKQLDMAIAEMKEAQKLREKWIDE